MASKPRRVYVAYRYNDRDAGQVLGNIGVAHKVAFKLIEQGCYPFIPHSDCLLAILFGKKIPLKFYYRNSIEWLLQCDTICVVCDGKPLSPGVLREMKVAKKSNLRFMMAFVNLETGEVFLSDVFSDQCFNCAGAKENCPFNKKFRRESQ
ncbi:MAG TPA: hypothetical protein ENG66_09285 [Thermococcus sp.]|nr:hypothetical protein [Thermococcus sp.]